MHFYTLSIWRQNAIDEQAVSQCQQNVFLTYNQVISWGYGFTEVVVYRVFFVVIPCHFHLTRLLFIVIPT